ncbi:MAG: DUF3096 domain-containing protein, partial [Pseudomonadota bacterium]
DAAILLKTRSGDMEALSAQPIVALAIGIIVLIFPRILNYAVAAYLIFIGVTGLWPNILS